MKRLVAGLFAVVVPAAAGAQGAPDWKAVEAEAIRTIQSYVRINTSNPPGDVTKAADLLVSLLQREGVPVKRYESAPGRSIVLARLKGTGAAKPILLLHHMDVVPTDPSRWQHDPFGAEIADGKIWGRGTMDMKGLGVVQLMAFLSLKRQNVPLERDVIFMAVPDEEVGGELGAQWMRKNHYDELDPEYVLDEGGFGSRDLFAPGKLVFGISVAEKKILWLKLRAEGVAGHGSQPHDRNPNDKMIRALARLLGEPMPTTPFSVLQTKRGAARGEGVPAFEHDVKGGPACTEQVQQRDPALDDLDHQFPFRRRRAAEGERHPVGCRGDARLPRPAGHDEGAVAGGDQAQAWRPRDQDRDHL